MEIIKRGERMPKTYTTNHLYPLFLSLAFLGGMFIGTSIIATYIFGFFTILQFFLFTKGLLLKETIVLYEDRIVYKKNRDSNTRVELFYTDSFWSTFLPENGNYALKSGEKEISIDISKYCRVDDLLHCLYLKKISGFPIAYLVSKKPLLDPSQWLDELSAKNSEILLDNQEIRIGQNPDNQIVIEIDEDIADVHARIIYENNGHHIELLSNTKNNWIQYNSGKKVTLLVNKKQPLEHMCEIWFTSRGFKYQLISSKFGL